MIGDSKPVHCTYPRDTEQPRTQNEKTESMDSHTTNSKNWHEAVSRQLLYIQYRSTAVKGNKMRTPAILAKAPKLAIRPKSAAQFDG
ncbi:uncharacterized protein UTRI_00193 [Ustilago trichophora]|uniref:Uncharacterized protein n=1 Tax=Ustilago trichophora TaxID=86804 RepID=A0A5C3DTI6_9BASI|nr:uncharacterized protein UTRI_00193 [Ustilago trichophora]